ncbi:hypothetical protein Dimus_035905 [Dionaea muscipula]
MAKMLKRVQGLYGLTAKNVAAKILGDASATSSEATLSQSLGPEPLQSVRMEEVPASPRALGARNKSSLPPRR